MPPAADVVAGARPRKATRGGGLVIGYLEGEGVGPEVVGEALRVLAALESATGLRIERRRGGAIGMEAQDRCGECLSDDVARFCEDVFAAAGAILAGPGGGRFVYDLRKRFDLFCKLSPVRSFGALEGAGVLRRDHANGADLLLVRENCSDVYMGTERETMAEGERRVDLRFAYSEPQVQRIVDVGARLAARRRGRMTVVLKTHGMPLLSTLWKDCARRAAVREGVDCECVDVDYAAYRLIQEPDAFDVVVSSNVFGDILADLCGVLMGSRGLTHGGSFSAAGAAVYQTNHGAAHDLAGTDRANPVGQILSLAMLLRESFGLPREAALIEGAVDEVWRQGWRTEDLAGDGGRVVGTRRMGELVAAAVQRAHPEGEQR